MGHRSETVLRFSLETFRIISNSRTFLNELESVFDSEVVQKANNSLDHETVIVVIKNLSGNYLVYSNGLTILRDSPNEARYIVMRIISDSFVRHISSQHFVMHAATAVFHSRAVVLSGNSGSGKTSLALEFSQFEGLAGDECGHINLRTGAIRYEPFPFQLKHPNIDLLNNFKDAQRIDVYDKSIGAASYFALSATKRSAQTERPIQAIIFPVYKPQAQTSINRLSSNQYAPLILGSLIGPYQPAANLSAFMSMCSERRIRFMRMSYSNVRQGAAMLYDALTEME